MKSVIAIAIIGTVALSCIYMFSAPTVGAENQFQVFISTYNVGYSNGDEFDYRFSVFQSNLEKIAELNKINPQATFGVNKFADRTPEEMSQMMKLTTGANCTDKNSTSYNVTDADWSGLYTSIKDQGQCGSCWAFSAVGSAEGRYAIFTHSPQINVSFSVQQLIDCDTTSFGCSGGWMSNAFGYWLEHDICNSTYYYTGVEGKCKICYTGIRLSSCDNLQPNVTAVASEISEGPISVAVDASSWAFYSGGILTNCEESLNHGVTLVGLNQTEGSVDIINSWGGSWGERGHIRLGSNGTCGWHLVASVPNFNETAVSIFE